MKYAPIPMSERTQKIKNEYLKMAVPMEDNPYVDKKFKHFCTGDRWITLGFLEGWLKNENAPTTRRRRSLAEAAELYAAEPVITDNELLTGQPYLPQYTVEEQERYDQLCEMFRMSNYTLLEQGPRIDHIALDLDKLLRIGVSGIIRQIDEYKSALDLKDENVYPEFDVIRKLDFYECCLIELKALLDLAERYAAKAREKAEQTSGKRKQELLTIADTLSHVPQNPARNFREAIQSTQFYLGTLFGLYPLNRPDRYLFKYYDKDIQDGVITREEAQELIDNYCLHVSNRVFSRAACGFIVGGRNEQGDLVENELTYMFLTALEHIRMPDPNGALAVSNDTSEKILAYAADILSKGTTHPAFFNDDVIIDSLVKYGCAYEDAVNYIHTTCAEISVVGKTKAHTAPFSIDLPLVLQQVVEAASSGIEFETLKSQYISSIKEHIVNESLRYIMRMLEASRNGYEPMRVSCLIDDCLMNGKSIYEGGERYCFLQPILVGFATAVDSLLAIKQIVYADKRFELHEFLKIIRNNYEGQELIRQHIIHKCPHYGNDDEVADLEASWLANAILNIFKDNKSKLLAGNIMMPGTFTYVNHASMGARAGASFDGRKAAVSYSDGCSPVQGRDTHGPTSMILSLTSWDQSAFLGGMVVNVKLAPSHLQEGKTEGFIKILRAFLQRGGIEMQVNVVNRQTLLSAREHPENHRDLLVRIGGFSDYFVRLSDALQLEIIERTEH